MTFLELVQMLHREAGLSGTAPSTVVSQTGMNLNLVNWINTAYRAIQGEYETWLFRIGEFDFDTISGIANYTPAAAGVSDLMSWKFYPYEDRLSGIQIYESAADENHLDYLPWQDFRSLYLSGSNRTHSSRPSIFSVKYDKSLQLWGVPDGVYTVSGEYIKSIDTLDVTDNADTTLFSDLNEIIVWRALMYYGASEGAPEVYVQGENEYNNLLLQLMSDQLPAMSFGPTLA